MEACTNIAQLRVDDPKNDESGAIDTLASLLKALGDPLRLQVLRLLKGDSLSVSELCEVFDLRQSALSHHLKVLVQADLLARRREGTAIFYRRQLPTGDRAELINTVIRQIDDAPLEPSVAAGLLRVERQREQNSLLFFRDNAARFKEQKELIAASEEYALATLHLLDRCGDLSETQLLEVGPGDGNLLPALAERAGNVVALDNSEVMLNTARATAGHLGNVEFVQGDTGNGLKRRKGHFGAAVMNMVLHHTPEPDAVIQDVAELLDDNGWLIISELCAHDQAWARENCGDLWLGFAPQQLTQWAQEAGLVDQADLFIAQRNGFQIQVRLFQRRNDI